jgi:ABC-type dipeptide/oligopeptide/nickel transport system permease component
MHRTQLIYRLIFLALTILCIPAVPILIIFMGTNSPEYVINGTLNMSVNNEYSVWGLYSTALTNLITLNLGNSTSTGQPVIKEIISGFSESLKIVLPALIFSYISGTIIGFINKNKPIKKSNRIYFIFYIPMIVFSYLILFLADKIGIDFTSNIKFLFAIIVLSIYPTFIVANSFLSCYNELVNSDYYRFHLSTGMPNKTIFLKFMKGYFSLAYLSFFENLFIYMLSFIYFVESPFSINGVGNKFVLSIQRFDYPLIIGFCIISIILLSFINILVDFIKFRIDPRSI